MNNLNNNKIDVFALSRNWFNYTFENPDKVRPIHSHLYFFLIDKSNRLGHVGKFGIPTESIMEKLGIKSRITYTNCLNFLIENGFIVMVKKSNNQHSASVISLVKRERELDTAFDKSERFAFIKNEQATIQPNIEAIIQPIKQPIIEPNIQPTIHINIQRDNDTKNQRNNKTKKQTLSENKFSVTTIFKSIFEEFYFEKKKEKYYWTAKDSAKCKPLADKLIFKIKEKEIFSSKKETENYNADLAAAFKFFLSKISDNWILSNLSMAIIDSKFNEIITCKHDENRSYKNSKSDVASRKQTVATLKNLSESILDDYSSKNS